MVSFIYDQHMNGAETPVHSLYVQCALVALESSRIDDVRDADKVIRFIQHSTAMWIFNQFHWMTSSSIVCPLPLIWWCIYVNRISQIIKIQRKKRWMNTRLYTGSRIQYTKHCAFSCAYRNFKCSFVSHLNSTDMYVMPFCILITLHSWNCECWMMTDTYKSYRSDRRTKDKHTQLSKIDAYVCHLGQSFAIWFY